MRCPQITQRLRSGARLGPQNTSLVSQEPDLNPQFPEAKCKCPGPRLLLQINNPFPSSSTWPWHVMWRTLSGLKKRGEGQRHGFHEDSFTILNKHRSFRGRVCKCPWFSHVGKGTSSLSRFTEVSRKHLLLLLGTSIVSKV